MKKIVILGSTGSIGTQTLDVIDHLAGEWDIIGLSANSSIDLLEKQALKYQPSFVVLMNDKLAKELEYRLEREDIKVLSGMEGLQYLTSQIDTDLVVNALVGAVGLKPTLSALESGKKLALANKESLVIGGLFLKDYINTENKQLIPVDSEHNAIFQILDDHKPEDIKNILLTASGGPFLNIPADELVNVPVEAALKHPNWDMGGKITIDSATMMNKGLEVIEAHWLFQQSYDKIKVVVHPQSIIHSMVEFIDNTIMAEMGVADMRIPIQYALTYPQRRKTISKGLNFFQIGQLNFIEPDLEKFPALKLAYQAGREGGTLPVVLNAANEIAVAAFLNKKIRFTEINYLVNKVMDLHNNINLPELEEVFHVDNWARNKAEEVINSVINYC